MRFLHTADWHLGKTLRGHSRLDEQARALDQIAAGAAAAKVDAVLIAGDVYESAMPVPEAEELALGFLARLCREGIACVLIAGNHDQPRKLAALQELLENLRIHVRAEVRPAARGGVVELAARDGRERALVAALPFVPERKIVDAATLMQSEHAGHQRYADRLGDVLDALCASFRRDTVNLVLAHVLISGARFGTGERQLHLGEIFALSPERLPANAHYAALGHLHRPQEIKGAPCRAAYSGSLIELDFGEKEQDKRAVLIEAAPGRPARLEDLPITAGRRLRDLEGTLAELERAAAGAGDAFLRVTVRVSEPSPGIEDRVRTLLPNALDVRQEWPRADAAGAAAAAPRPRDARERFAAVHAQEHGVPPPAALAELFASVHAQALRAEDAT
jgi:exonuclease SbcD